MVAAADLGSPAEPLLGDIVLAAGVCAAEAADKHIDVADHAAHLVVHGTLLATAAAEAGHIRYAVAVHAIDMMLLFWLAALAVQRLGRRGEVA